MNSWLLGRVLTPRGGSATRAQKRRVAGEFSVSPEHVPSAWCDGWMSAYLAVPPPVSVRAQWANEEGHHGYVVRTNVVASQVYARFFERRREVMYHRMGLGWGRSFSRSRAIMMPLGDHQLTSPIAGE